MDKTIFAFTLWTKEKLEKGNCIFTETGDLVGRILLTRQQNIDISSSNLPIDMV